MTAIAVYTACRFAVVGAAAGAVAHHLYVEWRQWGADTRLPLARGAAEEAVVAWALGAAVGQAAGSIPYLLVSRGLPLGAVALGQLGALPLLAPLYLPAAFPGGRRWVARHVPYLIGAAAVVEVVVFYVRRASPSRAHGAAWGGVSAVALGSCGVLTSAFSHRHNQVLLHLTREYQAQGFLIPCGTVMPVMHLVCGDILALLLVAQAAGALATEWWVLCALTISSAPAIPNVLTQYNRRPVDLELAIWVHFGALGAVFVLTLMFPQHPVAWAMANQLWLCHGSDWRTLAAFEEEPRHPPAWPFADLPVSEPPHPPAALSLAAPPPRKSDVEVEAPAAPRELSEAERRERRARAAEDRLRTPAATR